MDSTVLAGVFVFPAIAFAVAYFPMVSKLSRGLASPYAKADISRRLSAATIDGMIVISLGLLYWTEGSLLAAVAGAAYLLLRDSVNGQSIGKFLFGLVVISLETGRPSSLAGSVRRNLLFLLPGANVVAIFLEARTIVRDRQGQRLGDTLAQTQVVEGFGARELVKSFQELLMGVGDAVGSGPGRRRRAPVRTDRAACIALCAVWTLVLFSPAGAAGQSAPTAFEMRLAETQPAPGLVEATVPDSNNKVYLHRETIVTNADVIQATVVPGITSVNFNVAITFNSAGAARMARATASHLNKPVAILIDGRVVAAPMVRTQIADEAVISGDFDRAQASAIAAGLNRR
jgi:uncharacterized RDD family membrane protein YckC